VALSRYDEVLAANILKKMVKDEERWMRMSAAWAAGASGMRQVVEAALPLLHDPDPSVRIQTLRSLAQHRRLPTRKALQIWLSREEDPMVLQYASEILGAKPQKKDEAEQGTP
jgi:HEAT repeat protein